MLHDHKHLCVAAAASVSIVVRCIVNCFLCASPRSFCQMKEMEKNNRMLLLLWLLQHTIVPFKYGQTDWIDRVQFNFIF